MLATNTKKNLGLQKFEPLRLGFLTVWQLWLCLHPLAAAYLIRVSQFWLLWPMFCVGASWFCEWSCRNILSSVTDRWHKSVIGSSLLLKNFFPHSHWKIFTFVKFHFKYVDKQINSKLNEYNMMYFYNEQWALQKDH